MIKPNKSDDSLKPTKPISIFDKLFILNSYTMPPFQP